MSEDLAPELPAVGDDLEQDDAVKQRITNLFNICLRAAADVREVDRDRTAMKKKNERILEIITDLIENIELLCFDLGICDYIFEPKDGKALQELFERCFELSDTSSRINYLEPESLRAHLSYLLEKIEYFQGNTQSNQSNCPTFDSIRRSLNDTFQQHLKQAKSLAKKSSSVKEVSLDVPVNLDEYFSFDPSPAACAFAKFIYKHVLRPGTLTPELKDMLNRVSYRLTVLQQLQHQISVVRDLAADVSSDEAEDVSRSPHMELLADCCCFLKRILTVMDRSKLTTKLREVSEMLKDERDSFSQFCAQLVENESNAIQELEASLVTSEKQREALKQSLGGSAGRVAEAFLDNIPVDEECDLRSVFQKIDTAKMMNLQHMEKLRHIERLLDEGNAAFVDGIRDFRKLRAQERLLVTGRATRLRNEDCEHRFEQEYSLLDEYQNALRAVISTKNSKTNRVLASLTGLLKTLNDHVSQSEILEAKVEKLLTLDQSDVVMAIEQKKTDIDSAKETLKNLDEELGRLEIEMYSLREKAAARAKIHEEQVEDTDEFINSVFESNLKSVMEKITCPLCKSRKRDTIITTCGHALCRRCIDDCEIRRSCPVCLKSYTLTSLRPFLQ